MEDLKVIIENYPSVLTKVRFECELEEDAQQAIAVNLATGIVDHIRGANEEGNGVIDVEEIDITVTKFLYTSGYFFLKMKVFGIVNQINFHKKISIRRKASTIVPFVGSLPALVLAPVIMAADYATRKALGASGGTDAIHDCMTQSISEICIQLDKLSGRSRSEVAIFWKLLTHIRWGITGLTFIVAYVTIMLSSKAEGVLFNLLAPAFLGLFPTLIMFVITYCFALLIIPMKFFEKEPEGRKAMSMSGVQSVMAMKIIVSLILFILLSIVALYAYICIYGDDFFK